MYLNFCAGISIAIYLFSMQKSYSGNDIEKALSEVRKTDGLTARAAARKYGLASSTLHDH